MGYPLKEELIDILKANFTTDEVRVVLALPTGVIPFETVEASSVATRIGADKEDVAAVLDNCARRGLLYTVAGEKGKKRYALQQFGYGFPQTFFWGGIDDDRAKRMAELIVRYSRRDQLIEAYGRTPTKPFRYLPASGSIDPEAHAVFPFDMMEKVVERAGQIALVHCACRATAELIGRRACIHPLESCIKYDELADYVIAQGIGREISKDEALAILKEAETAGLVHLVDNAREGIKHTCNCCGCCCWSVSTIGKRRIPRDVLMATYFLRETDQTRCTGCGLCVDSCPVKAIDMDGDFPQIDRGWCIGCGLCALPCPEDAVYLVRRSDALPPEDFAGLHTAILKERRG